MNIERNGRTILVAEDELEIRGYLEMALKCLGYNVEFAQDGDEAQRYLRSSSSPIAAVLLDVFNSDRNGLETLQEIRRLDSNLPIIIISGDSSTLNVVAAMKSGATDFLCKPIAHEDLRRAITKAMDARAVPAVRPMRLTASTKSRTFAPINLRMREIHTLIAQIGWSEVPVLIQGETGTGKEIIARELHAASPRAGKAFLKLNCAALPSELVESELFGYERGAFTGAFQRKAGMFELADGGTLLLDEIGDMDVRLQAKLLQVLQDQEFQRIGGRETTRVDVRVLAATHRDIERALVERAFREDLYYRLNVISMQLPPLRERQEDIVPLAEFLLSRHCAPGVAPVEIGLTLSSAMLSYHWPGNVRELENTVRKLAVLRNPEVVASELMAKISQASRPAPAVTAPVLMPVVVPNQFPLANSAGPILEQMASAKRQAEKNAIEAALNATRWNRKQAAIHLQVDYKALLYKMKKLGVKKRPASGASKEPAVELPAHPRPALSTVSSGAAEFLSRTFAAGGSS